MKAKIFYIGVEAIGSFVKTTQPHVCSIKGAPADSEIVSCYYVHENRCFALAVKHDSFEDIPDGEKLPEAWAQITRHPVPAPPNSISMN